MIITGGYMFGVKTKGLNLSCINLSISSSLGNCKDL